MKRKPMLWGKAGGVWHALTRHDPKYLFEKRESKRLTMLARRADPGADPVMIDHKMGHEPGTALTVCLHDGVSGEAPPPVQLESDLVSPEGIAVDPDSDLWEKAGGGAADAGTICPVCDLKTRLP